MSNLKCQTLISIKLHFDNFKGNFLSILIPLLSQIPDFQITWLYRSQILSYANKPYINVNMNEY